MKEIPLISTYTPLPEFPVLKFYDTESSWALQEIFAGLLAAILLIIGITIKFRAIFI